MMLSDSGEWGHICFECFGKLNIESLMIVVSELR